MKTTKDMQPGHDVMLDTSTVEDVFLPLVLGQPARTADPHAACGVRLGELVALRDGHVPLVTYPGQPGSAVLPARSIVDLQSGHIGKHVALLFEAGDASKPIVIGIIRAKEWPLGHAADQAEVHADGERLIVSARNQIVLRCGRASITLTQEGKVLIQGTYVSSRSSGVHRIKGGSVEIN